MSGPEAPPRGRWADLPPDVLRAVLERVEDDDSTWPARKDLAACALVCRSWRMTTRDAVMPPEESGTITFPSCLKQPGLRDDSIHCYIRKDDATGTCGLYLGMCPALNGEDGKLLLAARKTKHVTSTEYVISLVSGDFSRASTAFMGKLRSNFLGTKFTVFDSQPPLEDSVLSTNSSSQRLHSQQVSPKGPAGNYLTATICYVMQASLPGKMACTLHSIPKSADQEGTVSPTPTDFASTSLTKAPRPVHNTFKGPLILKNKAARWHQKFLYWCLNFKGRAMVASVHTFQLVAAADPYQQEGPLPEQDSLVILQCGKIAKDVFIMDYTYPLSAFQAFAICLSSFDAKPVSQ